MGVVLKFSRARDCKMHYCNAGVSDFMLIFSAGSCYLLLEGGIFRGCGQLLHTSQPMIGVVLLLADAFQASTELIVRKYMASSDVT